MTKAKKVEVEKRKSTLDKYFNRTASENAMKAPEEPYHSEDGDGDNVGSQPHDMPDSESVCTGSEVSHFENIEHDKEGINKIDRPGQGAVA